MNILAWIILGLVAGAIAKAVHPGPDPGGVLGTIIVGVLGALIGGFVGSALLGHGLSGFSLWSLVLAVAGAFVLLVIYRMVASRSGPRRVT